MRFAKQSSTSSLPLLGGFALAAGAALVALWAGSPEAALVAVGLAGLASVLIVFQLLLSERRRHALAEEELAGQASFLESLVESFGEIALTLRPAEVLEQARSEAERLFGGEASRLAPGEAIADDPERGSLLVPLQVRGEDIGGICIVRDREFERADMARATVLGDFAARVYDNARLRAEAEVRETERARLSDQLITAEQDERRRLALFLHDTAVQSLSGVALMLDAAVGAIEAGDDEQAAEVMRSALERHRATIGSLRDLSFALEPLVLRDQGFTAAVSALVDQLQADVRIDMHLDMADGLAEKAQAALYQIIRESLHAAIRRAPSSISLLVERRDDGGFAVTIADDGREERRRAFFDSIAERARTLSGTLAVEQGERGGTTLRVTLPPYAAH
ncbi:MAG: histidine kinase [Actinomycetota bacterium]|nr:histidine kinase [Actinomycetota bacterium]